MPTYNPNPSYSQTKSGPDKEKWHQAKIQEKKMLTKKDQDRFWEPAQNLPVTT